MTSLSILVDLDGIVADLHPAWHERALACCWNERKAAPSGTKQIMFGGVGIAPDRKDPTLEEVLATYDGWTRLPCGAHVFDHLDHDLFTSIAPITGAISALQGLVADGHEVTIVTASAKHPATAAAKLAWVESWLGWSRHSVIVAQRKHLIHGDVLVDDAPKNLAAWKARHPSGHALTIAYPYNAGAAVELRAESWREPARAWAELLAYVTALAKVRP